MAHESHKVVAAGRFLRFVDAGGWEYVERTTASGVVVIVAVNDRQQLLLVEQYRPPVKQHVIELPAGLVGDEPGESDEAFESAVQRELLEETGYRSERITLLSRGPTSAGLTSEVVALFLAEQLQKVGPGGGTAGEEIQVHEIAVAEVPGWLEEQLQSGKLVDPKVYAGLHFVAGPTSRG